jgi:hypothetical protein
VHMEPPDCAGGRAGAGAGWGVVAVACAGLEVAGRDPLPVLDIVSELRFTVHAQQNTPGYPSSTPEYPGVPSEYSHAQQTTPAPPRVGALPGGPRTRA